MIIGIEASRANKPNKTGVEWYSWHLIQQLKRLTQGSGDSWILYTNEPLKHGLEQLPNNWYEVRLRWPLPKGWTQIRLSYELWRRKPDAFFVPAHTLPRVYPKQSVVTIHDIGFRRRPDLYRPRDLRFHLWSTKEIAKKAARIITVSEFCGKEIAEVYGVDPARIAITPNGIDHEIYRPVADTEAIEQTLRRLQIVKPYFLTIGRLEAKKNIVNLIKAFNLFKARRGVGDPFKLVLAGSPGFRYEEIAKELAASPVKDDIILPGYISEAEKPLVINGATAFIHPSWYEGFGIPVVEAMACGTPVISSDAASLPEVIGPRAAVYFAPGEIDQLAQSMAQVSDNAELCQTLRMAGIEQAAKFSWRRTAELTLPVLTNWPSETSGK